MALAERIKRPQDLIPRLDLVLTAADGRELEVDQEAPELRARLRGGADRGDEVIVEGGAVGAVVGELEGFGCRVEGVGRRVARGRVRVEVGAVAFVGAAGSGGDVARPGENGGFVDGGGGAFDAEVDDGSVATFSRSAMWLYALRVPAVNARSRNNISRLVRERYTCDSIGKRENKRPGDRKHGEWLAKRRESGVIV